MLSPGIPVFASYKFRAMEESHYSTTGILVDTIFLNMSSTLPVCPPLAGLSDTHFKFKPFIIKLSYYSLLAELCSTLVCFVGKRLLNIPLYFHIWTPHHASFSLLELYHLLLWPSIFSFSPLESMIKALKVKIKDKLYIIKLNCAWISSWFKM